MSNSLQIGSQRPMMPAPSALRSQNKKPAQIAFRGNENQQSEQNKPTINNDDFRDVTLLKRVGKFFKDIGKAFQTLFSNRWAWRFDAVVGQFKQHAKRIASDKEAEGVMQDFCKQNQQQMKEVAKEFAATPEKKKEVEKHIKEAEEAQKDNAVVRSMLIDRVNGVNELLSSHTPKQVAEIEKADLEGKINIAKIYMEEVIKQRKETLK